MVIRCFIKGEVDILLSCSKCLNDFSFDESETTELDEDKLSNDLFGSSSASLSSINLLLISISFFVLVSTRTPEKEFA